MDARGWGIAAALALGAPAAADVVTDWNEAFLDAIRVSTARPCQIARASAILHVAIYDSVNSVERTHEPYALQFAVPASTSIEAAVAAAAHATLSELYSYDSDLRAKFDATLDAHLAVIPDGPDKETGIALGESCAAGILSLRKDDGSSNDALYTPGSDPGDWVPTPPDYSRPSTPNWYLVKPWAMLSGDQFRPAGPAGYSVMAELLASPDYAANFNEVKELGAIDSKTRTAHQTETARFWANDRVGTFMSVGQLFHLTQVVVANEGNTLAENARLFAFAAIALADGGLVAWDAKFATDIDFWRPITAIRRADLDGNDDTEPDPDWIPLSNDPGVAGRTPPFPAYVSGHAAFAATHAATMRGYYGTDSKTFTIGSDDLFGVFRTYDAFSEAALECGRSRVYLGVHWQFDADAAYTAGTALGEFIMANYLRRLGDVNADGTVDIADLLEVLSQWGACPEEPSLCPADMDHSGSVDLADLLELLLHWD